MINKKLGKTPDQIRKAIEYSQNINNINSGFFPVVLCASSLRKKYPQLLESIRRKKSNVKNPSKIKNYFTILIYYDPIEKDFRSWNTQQGVCPYISLPDYKYESMSIKERFEYFGINYEIESEKISKTINNLVDNLTLKDPNKKYKIINFDRTSTMNWTDSMGPIPKDFKKI